MAGQNVVTVNEQNFETEVLKSAQPVLVDFWAEWCGPCKQIAPLIDELATEYAGKAKIGKINVDENQGLAARFGIRGIPTLLLFNQGQVTDQIVGMRSKRDLKAKLDAVVGA